MPQQHAPTNEIRWYMAGLAMWWIPAGIQAVVFPWLVAVELGASAATLGVAQMLNQLPMLLLVLFGGLLADRVDQRSILIRLHLLGALPALVLAAVIAGGALSLLVMFAYALCSSAAGAFAQPARDAALNRLAGADLPRLVPMALGMQFGVQVLGYLVASSADSIGAVPVLATQGLVLAAGALASARLRPSPPMPREVPTSALHDLLDSFRVVFRSARMRPAFLMMLGVGVFFAGSFMVLMPLMLRDLYAGGSAHLSAGFGVFMLGTITSIAWQVRIGGIIRQGRALELAALAGCITLLPLALGVPLWAFYLSIFVWGAGGGVVLSTSRTILQEAAPATHRARVMAVFSLANMGGMPLGSLVMGLAVEMFGLHLAVLVPCGGVAVVLAVVHVSSSLWQVTRSTEAPARARA